MEADRQLRLECQLRRSVTVLHVNHRGRTRDAPGRECLQGVVSGLGIPAEIVGVDDQDRFARERASGLGFLQRGVDPRGPRHATKADGPLRGRRRGSAKMRPMPTKEQVTEKLTAVIDPELRRSIVELGMVRSIDIRDDGRVEVVVSLTTPGCPIRSHFQTGGRPEGLRARWGQRASRSASTSSPRARSRTSSRSSAARSFPRAPSPR